MLLGIYLLLPGLGMSISCHVSRAHLPLSTLGPGEHIRLGSMGPEVRAHLISPEDGQWLSHGLSMGQDEVQHPISIEVCHHTPCNNADCTLAIGQETHGERAPRPVPCPQPLVGEMLGQEDGLEACLLSQPAQDRKSWRRGFSFLPLDFYITQTTGLLSIIHVFYIYILFFFLSIYEVSVYTWSSLGPHYISER